MQSASATPVRPKPETVFLPGQDGEGAPVFSVLLKRSYALKADGTLARAEADEPLRKIDEYWDKGDPETATVKFEADMPLFYPRNPMGKGLAVKNMREMVHGLALPNLEDPEDLLTPERLILEQPEGWRLQPMPQGLGWYPRTCYPRSFFAGSIPPFLL